LKLLRRRQVLVFRNTDHQRITPRNSDDVRLRGKRRRTRVFFKPKISLLRISGLGWRLLGGQRAS